jgi:hypothetical protein
VPYDAGEHHVDAFDFVPVRRTRCLADNHFGIRNIDEVILVRYKKWWCWDTLVSKKVFDPSTATGRSSPAPVNWCSVL